MTKNPAILAAEKGTASSVALAVLCSIAFVQIAALARILWPASTAVAISTTPASRPAAASPLAPVAPAPSHASQPLLPATNSPLTVPSLPGGMAMPVSGQPSLPTPASSSPAFANPLPPSAAGHIPPPPTAQPAALAQPRSPAVNTAVPLSLPPHLPISPSAPAPVSRTGNAQVDELVEAAQQLRDLKDYAGAIEVLERADLIATDNAVVLRELMVTHQLKGETEKAAAVGERLARISGRGAASSPAAGTSADAGRSFDSFDTRAAPQPAANGPMKLGAIEVLHDTTVVSGQRLALRVPIIATPSAAMDPDAYNLDVFFYDQINGVPAYPTIADPPVKSDDGAFDFKQGGQEILKIVYNLPELTAAEVAEFGQRSFLGYVVKLYYQGKLMGVAADPGTLLDYKAPATSARKAR